MVLWLQSRVLELREAQEQHQVGGHAGPVVAWVWYGVPGHLQHLRLLGLVDLQAVFKSAATAPASVSHVVAICVLY